MTLPQRSARLDRLTDVWQRLDELDPAPAVSPVVPAPDWAEPTDADFDALLRERGEDAPSRPAEPVATPPDLLVVVTHPRRRKAPKGATEGAGEGS